MKRRAVLCLLLVSMPVPVYAAPKLADGIYRCTISSMHLGDMEIIGDRYRGPAYDENWEGTYVFEETDKGTINWGGPLGGISEAGIVVSTVLTDAGKNRFGYDITIQNKGGSFQTVSCYPQ